MTAPRGVACRGGVGKCYYDDLKQEAYETNIMIKGGQPASTSSQYLRFYIRYGQHFGTGNHKLFRIGDPDSVTLAMWNYGILYEPDDTCIVDGFIPSDYAGQWLKIESWLMRNGPQYQGHIWVTTEAGQVFEKGCSFADSADMTDMKLAKNRSGSSQGDFWLDDICGGKTLAARSGICADNGSTPPPPGDPPPSPPEDPPAPPPQEPPSNVELSCKASNSNSKDRAQLRCRYPGRRVNPQTMRCSATIEDGILRQTCDVDLR